MEKQQIILVGGGGHAKSVIDVMEAEDRWAIIGVVDVRSKVGETISGYPIIATDDELGELAKQYQYFFITLGQLKSPSLRVSLFQKLKSLEITLPIIISPRASISRRAVIHEGTVVMHHAFVNVDAVVGMNCILNTGCIIEHDVIVGNHCHVSTGAVINGGCIIGDEVFVGSKAVIKQGIRIGGDCIIGAGAVVVKDTEAGGTYVGNPARLQ